LYYDYRARLRGQGPHQPGGDELEQPRCAAGATGGPIGHENPVIGVGEDNDLMPVVSGSGESGLVRGDTGLGGHVHVICAEDGQQWAPERFERGYRVVVGDPTEECQLLDRTARLTG
jgi:hypothetical protein